jgi:hypothetical protein
MMKLGLGIPFFSFALAASACHIDTTPPKQPKSTSELALGEITVDLSAQSYEDGKIGLFGATYYGGNGVPLGIGDDLVGTAPGLSAAVSLVASSSGGDPEATVALAGAPPFDVSITFARASSIEATSTVSLPAPPHVVSAPTSLTQGSDLVLELDAPPPPGVKVRLRLLSPTQLFGNDAPECLHVSPNILEPTKIDGARLTLASSALFARDPKAQSTLPKSCSMNVGVRFETQGIRADQLGGGTISGLMERPAVATPIAVTRTDS